MNLRLCIVIYGLILNLSINQALDKFTLYGTANNEYSIKDWVRSYGDDQAFQGDSAHHLCQTKWKSFGCINAAPPPAKCPNCVRITSFNVHNFHQVCDLPNRKQPIINSRKNPNWAINKLKTFNSDIVLFQEYVSYADDPESLFANNQFPSKTAKSIISSMKYIHKQMSSQLKLNDYIYSDDHELRRKSLKAAGKQPKQFAKFMGKAIYAKHNTLIKNKSQSYAFQSNGARGALRTIVAPFKNKSIKLLVYNVHLTLQNVAKTRYELKALWTQIDYDMKTTHIKYVILMGDFNNDVFSSSVFNQWNNDIKGTLSLINGKTMTAFNQGKKVLDLIYVSKHVSNDFTIVNKGNVVIKSDASDHWPVYIDLKQKSTTTSSAIATNYNQKEHKKEPQISDKKLASTNQNDKQNEQQISDKDNIKNKQTAGENKGESKKNSSISIGLSIGFGLLAIAIVAIIGIIYYFKNQKSGQEDQVPV